MRKIAKQLLLITALVPIWYSTARAEKHESIAINYTAQAISTQTTVDVSPWDNYSAQAVYSDGTPSSHTITSGSRASATITVGSNPSGLIGAQASITINIKSTTSISGKSVNLNGTLFTAGTHFTIGASTTATATNMAAKIDADPFFAATSAGSTVTVKVQAYGSAGNGIPATTTSSTNFGLSAATFSGGINRNTVTINSSVFTEGVDWNANASSVTTAISLRNAINNNTDLIFQVIATTSNASPGVLTVQVLHPLISTYGISTSSSAGLSLSGNLVGGSTGKLDYDTAAVQAINGKFNQTSHGFTTGLKVRVDVTAGTAPQNLVSGTTYFAIKLNDNQYQLATTSTTAAAGTAITISTFTDSTTLAMVPQALSLAAGNGFFWEASNDNANWNSLTGVTVNGVSVSSVTYAAAGSTIWDFGSLNYKYLRANYTGPTNGGIRLVIRIFGKKD